MASSIPTDVGSRAARRTQPAPLPANDKPRRLARLVLEQTLAVVRGESVTIDTWDATLPWANAFVLECHRIGAFPTLLLRDEFTFWKATKGGAHTWIGMDNPAELSMLDKTDAYVEFWGPSDTARESRLPPKLKEQRAQSIQHWRAAANRAGLRLAVLYMGRVGEASARRFGISEQAWRNELVDASLSDPAQMDRIGRRLAARLQRGSELVIDHANGTHLALRLKGRTPFVFGGKLRGPKPPEGSPLGRRAGLTETVIPAGYVVVAADEEKAEGRFVANVPSEVSVWTFGSLTGGIWEFSGGRLVGEAYRSGGGILPPLERREGQGHDQVSIVDFGLNPNIKNAPWMRDQRLGTVTVGVGANRFFGGTNGSSFRATLHLTGARVTIDGRTVLEGGRFL